MTALRWHSITGCAAIVLLVCDSCCAQSGYHGYGLCFHLSSLYFTVSNSFTVCVPTAFVHVRTVTLSWLCLKPLAEVSPSSLLFHPHINLVNQIIIFNQLFTGFTVYSSSIVISRFLFSRNIKLLLPKLMLKASKAGIREKRNLFHYSDLFLANQKGTGITVPLLNFHTNQSYKTSSNCFNVGFQRFLCLLVAFMLHSKLAAEFNSSSSWACSLYLIDESILYSHINTSWFIFLSLFYDFIFLIHNQHISSLVTAQHCIFRGLISKMRRLLLRGKK